MSGTTFKQDLPPPGGYKPIPYLRVPAKQYFSGLTMFVLFNVITGVSMYIWKIGDRKLKANNVEDRSARLALQPMLFAEKDRFYLQRCRRVREEEEELMKDVPGWVVGTYYGEPIYHTRPENEWHPINYREYFAHTPHHKIQFFNNFYKYL